MDNKDFNSYVHWAFQGILAAAITAGVWILADLNKSVQTLNVNMAVMVTQVGFHGKDIDEVKGRLKLLEEKTRKHE